ncbi:hypothetical protein CWE27_26315, partial [Streptomyces sp. EAG2]
MAQATRARPGRRRSQGARARARDAGAAGTGRWGGGRVGRGGGEHAEGVAGPLLLAVEARVDLQAAGAVLVLRARAALDLDPA